MNKPAINAATLTVVLFSFLPLIAAWQCASLSWRTDPKWYGGDRLVEGHYFVNCSTMVTHNEIHRCSWASIPIQCVNDSSCPAGDLCSPFMSVCVTCDKNVSHSWDEFTQVETNVSKALLSGKMWGVSDFYNHTGVDLIVTEETWSWSPSGNALSYDWVRHTRTTWGDQFDGDLFRSGTQRITDYNASHVQFEYGSIDRTSYDNGKGQVQVSGGTQYYVKYKPPMPKF